MTCSTRPPIEGTDGFLFDTPPAPPARRSVPNLMGALVLLGLGCLAYQDDESEPALSADGGGAR